MTTGRKIILAIDASDQAEHAFNSDVQQEARIAGFSMHGYLETIHRPENQIVLVHCPEVLDADRNKLMYLTAAAWEDAVKKEQAKVKELEEKYNGRILENGMSGTIRTEGGVKPGEAICRIANDEQATMIVMGTRGLGKVRRTIMGSVSDYVVHHAHCPVIVCRQ